MPLLWRNVSPISSAHFLPKGRSARHELAELAGQMLACGVFAHRLLKAWIDAAQPGYPCLIDRDHHLADLYNLVNVPQAVWIDGKYRLVVHPTDGREATLFDIYADPAFTTNLAYQHPEVVLKMRAARCMAHVPTFTTCIKVPKFITAILMLAVEKFMFLPTMVPLLAC